MEKSVQELVLELERNDLNEVTTSKYVTSSMREDIEKTEAYLNSKHISGATDYMGREKPFFNIVTAARNIWYRATDIDRKNIIIRATSQKTVIPTFLANLLLDQWMKEVGFGKFLNDWGLTLASHGSAVTKFVEKDGELSCQVIDWNNLLCDAIDFESNIKVEKLFFTPAQLRKNKQYDKELVDKLLDSLETRKTVDGKQKDSKSGYVSVYEVHGELSLAQFKQAKGEEYDEEDDDVFFQQMHVITFLEKSDKKGEYDSYSLYSGREKSDPYILSHLIKKDGQTYAGGAVKNLFEAQWMVNDTQKQIKDQLELASKIIYQTSDGQFVGQNALTNIENGDILNHKINEPLTRLAGSPDIAALQSYKNDWQAIANQINGTPEAMYGENPPSGTAWRLQEAVLSESHSLFELMTENKGLAIEDMMRTKILPFFKNKLNHSKELSSILDEHQIKQIDLMYLPNEVIRRVNKKKKDTILSGQIYDVGMEAQDAASAEAEIKSGLPINQRFITPSEITGTTWKEVLKDVNWEAVQVDVTGEGKDIKNAMSTLTTIFQTIASNPAILQDPNARLIFNKILNFTGAVSPLELSISETKLQPQQPQQPVMAGAP